jgi:hypothetical protein
MVSAMRVVAAGRRIRLLLLVATLLVASACSDEADSAGEATTDTGYLDTQQSEDAPASDDLEDLADADAAADAPGVDAPTAPDASAPDTDASAPDAGQPPAMKVCLTPCSDASDCGQDGPALYDSNHYACVEGVCRHQGCRNDAECTAAFEPDYACDDSLETPGCRRTCSSPSDCAIQGSEMNSADNYACVDQFCEWLGCNDNQECVDDLGDGHICMSADSSDRLVVPSCVDVCTTASDCASPTDLYGEDNYVCEAGGCLWTGCNDDDECEGLVNVDLVCR